MWVGIKQLLLILQREGTLKMKMHKVTRATASDTNIIIEWG